MFDAKMIAEPSAVQRSSVSSNSIHASSATIGSCTKLIGVSADASPIFSARVQAMCATVPKPPASTTHSHDHGSGHCHTNNAGTSDSGTQIIVVQMTIASGASVRDRNLMLIATLALMAAASSATSAAVENAWPHGRTMMSTPMKPTSTAVQRRARTTSPSTSTAPIVTNSGVE